MSQDFPAHLARFRAGSLVAGYRLETQLGASGMAVVFRARDERLGQLVALKILAPALAADRTFRRRFIGESHAAAAVDNPHIIPVYEVGEADGVLFIAMRFVRDGDLRLVLEREGALPPGRAAALVWQVASALDAAHRVGLVHGDVKPANILVDAHPGQPDHVYLSDFGVSTEAVTSAALTGTAQGPGIPEYAAPEQIGGREVDGRADQYALACVAYQLLTGTAPFQHGQGTAVGLPGAADHVLARALAKAPQNRYESCQDFAEALREALRPAARIPPGSASAAGQPDTKGTSPPGLPRRAPAGTGKAAVPAGPLAAATGDQAPSGPPAGSGPATRASRPAAEGSTLIQPAQSGPWPPGRRPARARRGPVNRRTATAGAAALLVAAAAVLAAVLLTGHSAKTGPLAANQGSPPNQNAAATLPTYSGQQQRGVFQTIDRIVATGNTIVTTGWQTSDGVTRQQFLASSDGGATWHLAPVQLPGGGPSPQGKNYAAMLIAGGPHGWVALGPQAIWTSQNGLSWTLAATHGITPQFPGDSIDVVTGTADGFVAGGAGTASGGGRQAVIWVSHDGISWKRLTAAQLGLTTSGQTATNIDFATSRGNDTVISDRVSGVWLSTDGGSTWRAVTVPVGYGAQDAINGVSFDGSGLIAVRPGTTASGAADGVAYFSPNGQEWHFAGIIGQAGGWSPGTVKGSSHGFVVLGTVASQQVAYTSTGTGTTWLPTGSLGDASRGSLQSATVGADGAVIAVGSTNASSVSQQALFLKADTAGKVSPVSLADIPGGLIPEAAVNSTAVADGEQIAVGSADGYPAIWRRPSGGPSWTLVSPLSLVSGFPGLAALSSVSHGPAGWVATGTRVVFTSSDGIHWHLASGHS